MSYTKREWATGNVVGAVDLNRIENGIADIDVDEIRGWGVQETQLFSETVTTADDGEFNVGTLTYSDFIDSDTIIVTFDDTDYTCVNLVATSGEPFAAYGAPWSDALNDYDFTEYPFNLYLDGQSNALITETAGTHTVSAAATSIATSTDFAAAVNASADFDSHMAGIPFQCIATVTTATEMDAAISQGRLLYFWTQSHGPFFVSAMSGRTVTIFPESSSVTAMISTYGIFEYTEA